MSNNIQVGTILMKDWPLMTQLLGLESEPCSGNWSRLKSLDGFALDRKIKAAGWNFFFMAAEIKVMFFGALTRTLCSESWEKCRGRISTVSKSPASLPSAFLASPTRAFPHIRGTSRRVASWITLNNDKPASNTRLMASSEASRCNLHCSKVLPRLWIRPS